MIDETTSTILHNGAFTYLTKREMEIFQILFKAYPRITSKEHLYNLLYTIDSDTDQKILDVFVCKLRRKLDPIGVVIVGHWGRGYAIQTSAALDDATEARTLSLHRWLPAHDVQLKELVARKFSPQQIAAQLRMPYIAVGRAMVRMGLST